MYSARDKLILLSDLFRVEYANALSDISHSNEYPYEKMSIPHDIRAVSFEGTRLRATSNQLNKDNYTQWSARLKGILMINKIWDIVNEDRIKPPRPEVHELGEEAATPEAIAAAITVADKYDRYLEDYTRAACLLAESISDAELVAITTVFDDPIAIWTKLQ